VFVKVTAMLPAVVATVSVIEYGIVHVPDLIAKLETETSPFWKLAEAQDCEPNDVNEITSLSASPPAGAVKTE